MALYLQLLHVFVQYGNGSATQSAWQSSSGSFFDSVACCVFVNHTALGGNGSVGQQHPGKHLGQLIPWECLLSRNSEILHYFCIIIVYVQCIA